jgi:hypothetical protein
MLTGQISEAQRARLRACVRPGWTWLDQFGELGLEGVGHLQPHADGGGVIEMRGDLLPGEMREIAAQLLAVADALDGSAEPSRTPATEAPPDDGDPA